MKEKINCANAKRISIVEFLEYIGHKPHHTKGNDVWYLSPLRSKENKPSFKVNRIMNVWYDYGLGAGGTLIDLGITLYNCSVSDFLQNLESLNFSFQQQKKVTSTKAPVASAVKILTEKPITAPLLIDYLKERSISIEIAKKFCKEIEYSINGKTFYALGFPNNQGGYELRNKHFKGCCSPKTISLIHNKSKVVCVFEGFFDAMSHAEIIQETGFKSDILVLNSVALLPKALVYFDNYDKVFLYLDNNKAGNSATNKLKEQIQGKVEDMRSAYNKFEDLNQFLVANKKKYSSKQIYQSSTCKPRF